MRCIPAAVLFGFGFLLICVWCMLRCAADDNAAVSQVQHVLFLFR